MDGWRNEETGNADIFQYDPFQRADIAGMDPEAAYQQALNEFTDDQRMYGDFALSIGRTFTTLIQYAAEDLDWVEFMSACITEQEQCERLLDRCLACSQKNIASWLRTDIPIMLTHDDIAMSTGTIFSPDWLRQHLMPRYAQLFPLIKASGRLHLYMTDGNYSAVAADLAALGVDGFFIDPPCVDLERLANVAGKDRIYFTGVSPAPLMTGPIPAIRDEVKRLADLARQDLPRFFFHSLGAFMVPGVPTEHVAAYFAACEKYGAR